MVETLKKPEGPTTGQEASLKAGLEMANKFAELAGMKEVVPEAQKGEPSPAEKLIKRSQEKIPEGKKQKPEKPKPEQQKATPQGNIQKETGPAPIQKEVPVKAVSSNEVVKAMQQGGVLHGVIAEAPRDPQAALILQRALNEIPGNLLEDQRQDVLQERLSRVLALEKLDESTFKEVYDVRNRLILRSRGDEITPENLEILRHEATGSPRVSTNAEESFARGNESVFADKYDPNIIEQKSPRLAKIIREINKQTDLDPDQFINYASSLLADFKPEGQYIRDEELYKSLMRSQLERYRESTRHGLEIPTHFSLTQKEFDAYFRDPIGSTDKKAQPQISIMLQNPESAEAEEQLMRIKLLYGAMFSEDIQDEQIRIWARASGVSEETLRKGFEGVKNTFKGQLREYSDALNRRIDMAILAKQVSVAAQIGDKNLQGVVNGRLRESDFFGLGADMGGTVEIAAWLGRAELEKLLYDEKTGELRMILPQENGKLIKLLTERLKEKDITANLQPLYEGYLNGEYFIPNGDEKNIIKGLRKEGSTDAPTYENACESIATLAVVRMRAFMDQEKVLMRGLGPGEVGMLTGGDSYQTYERKAKILSVKQFIRHSIKIWENPGDAESGFARIFFRRMGENFFNAYEDNETWAVERTGDLWESIEKYRSGNLTKDQQTRLLGRLKDIYFFNDDPEAPCRASDEGFKSFVKNAKELTKEKLLEEVRVDCGVQLAETHLARAYFFEESAWRNSTVWIAMENQLFEAIKQKMIDGGWCTIPSTDEGKKEWEDQLKWGVMTSPRMLKAFIGYFNGKIEGDSEFKRAVAINEAAKVALYRPHSIAAMMHERDSHSFKDWFKGKKEEYNYKHAGEMFNEVSPKFELINAMLLRDALPPIDYSLGLDQFVPNDPRRKVILKCFGGDEKAQTKYFSVMGGLEKFLLEKTYKDGQIEFVRPIQSIGSEPAEFPKWWDRLFGKRPDSESDEMYKKIRMYDGTNIQELTSSRYEPVVIHERWSDVPYGLLENSRLIQGFPEKLERMRLSDIFTSGGFEESDGGVKRVWRDLVHAETVKNTFKALMSWQEEVFMKNIPAVQEAINGYMGPDAADLCIVQFAGARAAVEKVYKKFGPLFEWMRDSSDMRRHHPEAKSKSVDELLHFFDQVENALGAFRYNAPKADALMESMKETLDITDYRRRLGGEHGVLGRALGQKKYKHLAEWLNDRVPFGKTMQTISFIPLVAAGLVVVIFVGEADKQSKEEKKH